MSARAILIIPVKSTEVRSTGDIVSIHGIQHRGMSVLTPSARAEMSARAGEQGTRDLRYK